MNPALFERAMTGRCGLVEPLTLGIRSHFTHSRMYVGRFISLAYRICDIIFIQCFACWGGLRSPRVLNEQVEKCVQIVVSLLQ